MDLGSPGSIDAELRANLVHPARIDLLGSLDLQTEAEFEVARSCSSFFPVICSSRKPLLRAIHIEFVDLAVHVPSNPFSGLPSPTWTDYRCPFESKPKGFDIPIPPALQILVDPRLFLRVADQLGERLRREPPDWLVRLAGALSLSLCP